MRRAVFLASALDDFLAIFSFIAEQSGIVSTAEHFVREMRAKCHALAALESTVGRGRPELRPDIRGFPYKSYVIFFRYVDQRFAVVNIVERHRDIDAFFDDAQEIP